MNFCIRSITCDGCCDKYKNLHLIGFEISSQDGIPHIKQFNNNTNISCILDLYHILKLCRNSLAAETELNSPSGPIPFKFINKLHDLQEKAYFTIANSLSKQYINRFAKKIKVKIAAQTISASVAGATEFLSHPDFANSQASSKFKVKSPYPTKKRMVRNKNLPQHARKTFSLGFLVNTYSYKKIVNDMIYKMSQNYLELYFCYISSRTGWSNNAGYNLNYFFLIL